MIKGYVRMSSSDFEILEEVRDYVRLGIMPYDEAITILKKKVLKND